jgi:hypothetical protein
MFRFGSLSIQEISIWQWWVGSALEQKFISYFSFSVLKLLLTVLVASARLAKEFHRLILRQILHILPR